ncbi:MAG TPA: sulfite exporter TauE/SafE family protein [Longimicrobium sp.]|nr:sulfite exporter TauE/SafE family protein [Longimicrobium sp.]
MGWMVFLLIGLGAGVLSGLFGIGGGVVIIPALIFIARMQPQSATGTSLAALLLPVGALGAWEYYKTGNLNLGAGLLIALGLFVGAGVGARLSLQLSPASMRRAFAVFLALIAVRMWFSGDEASANAAAPPPVAGTPAP